MSGALRQSSSHSASGASPTSHKPRKSAQDDDKSSNITESHTQIQNQSPHGSRPAALASPPRQSALQVIETLESHLAEAYKALETHPNAPEHCLHINNTLAIWSEKFRLLATTFSDQQAPTTPVTLNFENIDAESHSSESRGQSHSWADAVKAASSSVIAVPSRIVAKLTSRHHERPSTPKKTSEQIHEKLLRAEESRLSTLTSKVKKARMSVDRVRSVNERMSQIEQTKQQQRQTLIEQSQKKADERREQQVQQKKTRAENEIQKVKENRTSSKASLETPAKRKQEMEERLQEAENRRRAQEEEKRRISQELANPRAITPEERFKRICKHCNAEIRLSEPISTHLISKRHIAALKTLGIDLDPSTISGSGAANMPLMAENCVIKVPLFPVVHSPPTEEEETLRKQRQEAGKRRAKKIKQKLSTFASQFPSVPAVVSTSSKSSSSILIQQLSRLFSDIKDQLTKRHTSLLESSLQKLQKLILTKSQQTASTQSTGSSVDNIHALVENLKGAHALVNIINTHTPTSGLSSAVHAALQILLILLKDDKFKYHFVCSNLVVSLIGLVVSAEKDESFLTAALKTIAISMRWPRNGLPSDMEKDSSDRIWTMTCLTVQYILNSSLLERIRWLFSQQGNLRSSDAKEFGIFIETVRLVSNVTAFVRIETDRIKTLPERPESADRRERLEVLTLELTQVLKETHFVGVLSHLASVLLQDGPIRQSKKRPLSRDLHFLSFCIVELFKSIAIFNAPVIQGFFGGSSYEQVEFYHVANFLLTHLGAEELSDSDSSTDGGMNSSGASKKSLSGARGSADNKIEARPADLLHTIVELIGLVCIGNPTNQQMVLWGQSPNILQRLLSLPFSYFSMRPLRFILFPTLIALCFNDRRNLGILQQEVSQDMLIEFLDDLILGKADASEIAAVSRRLPQTMWQTARDFFAESNQLELEGLPATLETADGSRETTAPVHDV